MTPLESKIVEIAKSYVGQEEIPENQGFKSQDFEAKMKNVGWYKGAPWCAFLAKLIWQEAFAAIEPKTLNLIKKYSTGSAYDTYVNYKKSAEFHADPKPKVGSLILFQEGNGHSGHAGVVIEIVDDHTVKTVEGNTNTDGSREGYEAAIKTRLTNKPHSDKGLNILGFIYPTRIA